MNLSLGSQGDGVKLLQTALFTMGYDIGPTGVDGIFGQNTLAAVKSFQADHGLTVDGIVGPETAAALSISLDAGIPASTGATSSTSGDTASSESSFWKWAAGGAALWWLKRKLF